jgi:hypothetical protein
LFVSFFCWAGHKDAIYFYFNGSAIGKDGEIVIIPKKIDLSPFAINESLIDEEIFTWSVNQSIRRIN